jgi:stearoyl-CoA desaturase (delta-9 desaturase)
MSMEATSEVVTGAIPGTPVEPREEPGAATQRPGRRSPKRKPTADEAAPVWQKHSNIPLTFYWGIHAASISALFVGATAADLGLLATTFFVRLFAITGGYHRYFSHRTYKTGRVFQFILAFLGTSAVQKGPLWWASVHRVHHKESDKPGDPHSPREGFWHSHQGWIFGGKWEETRIEGVPDLARYPELVFLNRYHMLAPVLLGILCFAIGGWSGFVWGFIVSTVLCWHSTYSINSLSHRWGTRRYDTGDDSRNNFFLALLTLGEGWHNNHHHYMGSARQGFYWWEIDITYYILRALSAVGLVWDMREPPARVYREMRAAEPRSAAS